MITCYVCDILHIWYRVVSTISCDIWNIARYIWYLVICVLCVWYYVLYLYNLISLKSLISWGISISGISCDFCKIIWHIWYCDRFVLLCDIWIFCDILLYHVMQHIFCDILDIKWYSWYHAICKKFRDIVDIPWYLWSAVSYWYNNDFRLPTFGCRILTSSRNLRLIELMMQLNWTLVL